MKDLETSRADSAAQSREGYKENLEKSHDDSVAWSRESYTLRKVMHKTM